MKCSWKKRRISLKPSSNEVTPDKSVKVHRLMPKPTKEKNRPPPTSGKGLKGIRSEQEKLRKSNDKNTSTEQSLDKIRIFTLNVWGLRTKDKLEDLKSFLHGYNVHICVVTETHLLKAEAKKKIFPGYVVADAAGIYTNKGGVLLLASTLISWREVPDRQTGHMGDISACTCIIYPTKDESYAIRLSGVYVPPSAKADIEMMAPLTDPKNKRNCHQGKLPATSSWET